MSTLTVSSITGNPTVSITGNTTINSALTVSGNLTTSGEIVPSSSFLRNRIINGAMHIWQRGTSFSSGYTADRWYHSYGNTTTFARSTDTPSAAFPFSMSVSGSNYVTLAQRIESVNSYDLVGQPVTVSFWVKQTVGAGANGIGVQLFFPTATDNYTSVTGTTNNFVTSTTGWTYVTTTFSAGTLIAQAANGIVLSIFANIAGSATFLVTGIQLEVGSVATPFERRQYGQELLLCQRYYETGAMFSQGPVAGTIGMSTGFSVTKRAQPTVVLTVTASGGYTSGIATQNITTASIGFNSPITSSGGFLFVTYTASAEI